MGAAYNPLMLYVATVHYKSPQWIEIQSAYLRKHISVPYQVWTSLEGIDDSYAVNFDRVVEQVGPHAGKLNHLAMEISDVASEGDLLMFLDGDAFPIADPMPVISEALAKAPLLAVRRAEHLDEPQPHPCFCVTTVGAWNELGGDWSAGSAWSTGPGRLWSDVGGNLLRKLELTHTPWVELLRSNGKDLDPLYFAIYGGIVYHHGSSFRHPTLSGVHHASAAAPAVRPVPSVPLLGDAVRVFNRIRWRRWERKTVRARAGLSRAVFERIRRDEPDWLSELGGAPGELPAHLESVNRGS